MTTPMLPEGWYKDPDSSGIDRYWSGTEWTERTRLTPSEPTPSQQPAVSYLRTPDEPTEAQFTENVPAVPDYSGMRAAMREQQEAQPLQVQSIEAQPLQPAPVAVNRQDVPPFFFDGGAATYVGTAILGALITVFTLGICYPFAVVLRQRWQAKHTYIEGRRLMFTGSAVGLLGRWILWWFLMVITLSIYSFWVIPRIVRWKVQHQAFDPRHTPPVSPGHP